MWNERAHLHTAFCISPERYLVYISLINYVFNFCAPRFMLVISWLLLVFVRRSSSSSSSFTYFHPVKSLFSLSSCLLIGLIYASSIDFCCCCCCCYCFQCNTMTKKLMRKCFVNELRAHAASLLIKCFVSFMSWFWLEVFFSFFCAWAKAHVSLVVTFERAFIILWKIVILTLPQHCCHRHCRRTALSRRSTLIKCF